MAEPICEECGAKPAILTVPAKIYWDERGEAVKSPEKRRVCRSCFWFWARVNIPEVEEQVAVPV